mgnify:CR=1 FL=1
MKVRYLINILMFSSFLLPSMLSAQGGQKNDSLIIEDLNATVNMAYGSSVKRDVTSSIATVRTADRITYDNTQWVRDYISGLMLGVKGSANIRGLNSEALFVIDGIPGRDVNNLMVTEIEEITVLKDISAVALYGAQGRNGAILITTKRGKMNQKYVAFNVNFGVSQPLALPKYLGAAEYMETYNEACRNDGRENFYAQDLIDKTRAKINPYKYPDVDFYSSEYLRDITPNGNVAAEFSGGTDKVQYYVNLGYKYDGNMVKINPDVNKGSNTFKVRGNIDFAVNKWIKSGVDVVVYMNSNKQAHTNIMVAGTTFLPNWYTPLLPTSMIDPEYLGTLKNINIFDGFILGADKRYPSVPFAEIFAKGYKRLEKKNVQVGNTIDFDLSKITKGLTAKTYLSLDYNDAATISVINNFNYYQPIWGVDSEGNDIITSLTPLGTADKKDQTEHVATTNYVIRYGFSGQINYDRTFNKDHTIGATLMGYSNSIQQKDVKQKDIFGHFGLRVNYDFQKKYYLTTTLTQGFSIKLPSCTAGGISPTVGLGYIISEEDFMKNISWLDFLKLNFTAGVLKSDLGINEYYLYQDNYNVTSGIYAWNDGSKSESVVSATRGKNNDLGFERRKEFTVGVQAQMFKSLWVDASFFRTNMSNQVVKLSNSVYPSFYDDFVPYANFNSDCYTGGELGVRYMTKIDNLGITVGSNWLYTNPEATKRDEVHMYGYQYRAGQPLSAIFGLRANGLYSANEFDQNGNLKEGLPVPQYGVVKPGDIKYLDVNNDKVIDDNDMVKIGRWDSPLTYSFNLKLDYKNFTFFMVADGQIGGNAMLSNSYYQSKGTDKYSEFIRNRWTEENPNPNAICPRITTGAGSNNFKTSTYWMYDNSYFRINRMQLTYEFDKKLLSKIGIKGLSLDIAGSNLVEFSKCKEYRQLTVGANPQKRYYSLGLRMIL